MEYITELSAFHGRREVYRGASADAAFRAAGCGECSCGGGRVRVVASPAGLRAAGAYRIDGGYGPLVIDHPTYGPIAVAD